MVNARDLGQVLGARAQVSGRTASARLSSGKVTLALSAGKSEGRLDGKVVTLPFAPVKAGDDLLVPLQFVVEALGHHMRWDAATRIAWVE